MTATTDTQVEQHEKLGRTVHVCATIEEAIALSPSAIFRRAEMLVIDNVAWTANLDIIQSGLRKRPRKFDTSFDDSAQDPAVLKEVEKLQQQADVVFDRLYPDFHVTERMGGFRPMITGPEPMHFDTRPQAAAVPFVTSFINISLASRVYKIGPNLYQLTSWYPKKIRQIRGNKDDVSYELRTLTMNGRGPLGGDVPKHRVSLAPGAIWFFDAKTVSHEVVYGEGAVFRAWCVPSCGVPQQPEILAGLH